MAEVEQVSIEGHQNAENDFLDF